MALKPKLIIAVAVVALVALGVWQWDMTSLETWIGQHSVLGAGTRSPAPSRADAE